MQLEAGGISRKGVAMKRTTLLAVCLFAATAFAAVRQGSTITIDKSEIIDGDLYLAGSSVKMLGTINGDLIVVGGNVDINGLVGGDVLVFGGMVTVAGSVEGTVRGLAAEVVSRALIGEDLAVATGSLTIEGPGAVGRDLLVAAGNARLDTPVGRDVEARVERLNANAEIGGHLNGEVEHLRLSSGAFVGGDVLVASPNEIDRHPSAAVDGKVTVITAPGRGVAAMSVVALLLRGLLGLFLLALIRRALFPGFSERSANALRVAPARSAGLGALAMVVAPAVSLVALLLGALIGGWWLGLIALGAFLVAALIAYPLVGEVLGEALLQRIAPRRKAGPWLDTLVGLAILLPLTLVPVLGVIVAFATVLFGLGAQLAALPGRWRIRSTTRLDQRVEAPFGPPVGAAG